MLHLYYFNIFSLNIENKTVLLIMFGPDPAKIHSWNSASRVKHANYNFCWKLWKSWGMSKISAKLHNNVLIYPCRNPEMWLQDKLEISKFTTESSLILIIWRGGGGGKLSHAAQIVPPPLNISKRHFTPKIIIVKKI